MTINTTENHTPLERALASLTDGPQRTEDEVIESGLWLKALEQTTPTSGQPIPLWKRTIPGPWLSAAAVLILFVLTAAIVMPSMTNSRGVSRPRAYVPSVDSDGSGESDFVNPSVKYSVPANGVAMGGGADEERKSKRSESSASVSESANYTQPPDGSWRRVVRQYFDPTPRTPASGSTPDPQSTAPQSPIPADRYVIRKTTLDLTATDVRTAFSKAGLIINEALGEYIETSSLTGEGPTARATVTLRVAANRLSEALNALRPLGVVVSEASTGQDVTDTVVDLEARLRNEQRIERELLQLIDKRPDAPLKDLMEIRSQLEQVRGQIESIMGQRERVGRLVSLATILVTINAAEAPPKPVEKEFGIGAYFKESIASAWHNSLVALADTAAFLVRTIVGGIVWWLIAILVATAAWKLSKRALSKRAAEPVPVG